MARIDRPAMRRALLVVLAVVFLAGCAGPVAESVDTTPNPAAGANVTATVTDVVDGDTIEIQYVNGTTDTVRLLGIDTPEVHVENTPEEYEGVPDTEAGATCLREVGGDASEYARSQLAAEQVRLVFDKRSDRRGSYGRLLAYVYLADRNVNYQLVAEGYARVYDSEFVQSDRFYAAESAAQSDGAGVWSCRDPGTTAHESANGLAVVEIHADAAGNDNENLTGEYLIFENQGNETLEMGGWTVEDEAGHRFVVPDEFALDPGDRVIVYTGHGTDSERALYWGAEQAIWNNGGDTVFVYDAGRNRRLERSY